jgi:cation diffusion facilitator CzcD-associated flavoprotein CzcO
VRVAGCKEVAMTDAKHVVIVGGGFAGLGCARRLAGRDDIRVTLIDKHNYHQFQPLFHQVATCQLASADVATSLRKPFRKHENVAVKMGEVTAVDPATKRVTLDSGRPSRVTSWSWRPGASRTSSTPRAPSTPSRSTRWTTPSGCARGSWRCSRTLTGTPRCWTAAR